MDVFMKGAPGVLNISNYILKNFLKATFAFALQ